VADAVAAAGAGVGLGLMPCFQGDTAPGLRRLLPPVAALKRDIWLVVHPDLQQSARVRAVMDFLSEVIQRDRPLLAGGGLASEWSGEVGSAGGADARKMSAGAAKRGKAASRARAGQARRGKARTS
jgi:hypothetical protein